MNRPPPLVSFPLCGPPLDKAHLGFRMNIGQMYIAPAWNAVVEELERYLQGESWTWDQGCNHHGLVCLASSELAASTTLHNPIWEQLHGQHMQIMLWKSSQMQSGFNEVHLMTDFLILLLRTINCIFTAKMKVKLLQHHICKSKPPRARFLIDVKRANRSWIKRINWTRNMPICNQHRNLKTQTSVLICRNTFRIKFQSSISHGCECKKIVLQNCSASRLSSRDRNLRQSDSSMVLLHCDLILLTSKILIWGP